MILDLQDSQYKASIKPIVGKRLRLVLDFPAESSNWEEIYGALGRILKPRDESLTESPKREGSDS